MDILGSRRTDRVHVRGISAMALVAVPPESDAGAVGIGSALGLGRDGGAAPGRRARAKGRKSSGAELSGGPDRNHRSVGWIDETHGSDPAGVCTASQCAWSIESA